MIGSRFASLLRANTWAPTLVTVALAAYCVAQTGSAMLAAHLRAGSGLQDGVTGRQPTPLPPTLRFALSALAERNLMGAKREPPVPPQSGDAPPSGITVGTCALDTRTPCTLPVGVRATLVADGAPAWSIAVIAVNNEAGVYSVNDGSNRVGDDAVLVAVVDRAIVVWRNDHCERCEADADGARGRFGNTGAATPTPAAVAAATATADTGIRKVGETEYAITRAAVDRALGPELEQTLAGAHLVPSFVGGKANGYKMFSIKPRSLFQRLGFQNGDIIQKVNGQALTTPGQGLELLGGLRDTSALTIEVQRRGTPVTIDYRVTP